MEGERRPSAHVAGPPKIPEMIRKAIAAATPIDFDQSRMATASNRDVVRKFSYQIKIDVACRIDPFVGTVTERSEIDSQSVSCDRHARPHAADPSPLTA
jgi:hypothetical protein